MSDGGLFGSSKAHKELRRLLVADQKLRSHAFSEIAEGSSSEEVEAARKEGDSLGLFVRSLVGLDRGAAKAALSRFLDRKALTANQIEFNNLIINHLSSKGWIELAKLYASPYTDIHPYGVDGLFDEQSTVELLSALRAIRQNASGLGMAV